MAKVRLRDLNPAKFLNNLEVDGAGEFGGRLDVNHDTVKLYNSENTSNTYFFVENTSTGNAGIKMKNSQGEFTIIANDRLRFISDDSPALEVLSLLPDGKVGIGSESPTTALEVVGGATISSTGWSSSATANSLVVDNNSGVSRFFAVGANASTDGSYEIYTAQTDGGTNKRITISSDGNVGINTGASAPSQILEIKSSSQTKLLINRDAANDAELEFKNTEQSWTAGIDRSNSNTFTIAEGTSLGNDIGLRVSTAGNVGIGTDASTSLISNLTVQASDQADLLIGSTGGARAMLMLDGSANGDGMGGDYAWLAHETDGRLTIGNSHAGTIINLAGRIGIATGSNTPNEKLHVVSAGSGSSGYSSAATRGILITDNLGPRVVLEDIGEGVGDKVMSLRNEDECFKIASMSDSGDAYDSDNILVVHRDGKVGIGVVPSSIGANVQKLNVNGMGLFNAGIEFRYGLSNSLYSKLETNGQTLTIRNVGTGGGVGDGHIILNTSRNVGVGSFSGTEPEYNLHVEGTLYANTISVGSGFNNLINAGQLTSRKNSSGQTADTDAALVIEQNVNPILEFLTDTGGNGTINFSSSTKGVAAIKVELPNKMQFWAGETLQLTLNQGGSNNVTFSRLGAGTVQSDADGNLSVSSSAALKTEVRDFTGGLSNINNLRPVKFKWKQDTGLDYHNDYVGFIAEEVEEELPDAVLCPSECCDNDEMVDNHKSKGLSDRAMIAALVNAVQELSTRVQQLENN